MRERPILFSTPMIQAIQAGRKWQDRRVVKWPLKSESHGGTKRVWPESKVEGVLSSMWTLSSHRLEAHPRDRIVCPYGTVGDCLWVRETWTPVPGVPDKCLYRADKMFDGMDEGDFGFSWRPSIHMPRWACRLVLEITEVRVQRLQEISREDAAAEGMCYLSEIGFKEKYDGLYIVQGHHWPEENFVRLWNSINGKKYPWSINPWVWALSFKEVTP